MKYTVVILFFLICACSAKSVTKSESDKISLDMSAFNYRVSGQLFRSDGELKGDLSKLSLQKYLTLLQNESTTSEKDYADFVRDHDLEFRIATNRYEFVVCFRSLNLHYGLCDIAGTNFIDREIRDKTLGEDLQKTTTELLNRKEKE